MNRELSLTVATVDDAALLEDLIKSAFAEYRPHFTKLPEPLILDYTLLAADGQTYLVWNHDDVVGCVTHVQDGDRSILRNLSVAPEFRGQGLGKSIVKTVEQLALNAGSRTLVLWTRAEMTDNHRFYLGLGYTLTDHANPSPGINRVVFEKILTGE